MVLNRSERHKNPHKQAKNESVRIGVELPLSGVYVTSAGNVLNGMNLYFGRIGWKAGGREIKLLKEEGKGVKAEDALIIT